MVVGRRRFVFLCRRASSSPPTSSATASTATSPSPTASAATPGCTRRVCSWPFAYGGCTAAPPSRPAATTTTSATATATTTRTASACGGGAAGGRACDTGDGASCVVVWDRCLARSWCCCAAAATVRRPPLESTHVACCPDDWRRSVALDPANQRCWRRVHSRKPQVTSVVWYWIGFNVLQDGAVDFLARLSAATPSATCQEGACWNLNQVLRFLLFH